MAGAGASVGRPCGPTARQSSVLESRRTTRVVRCAHCAQTRSTSQLTKRVSTRADSRPNLLRLHLLLPAPAKPASSLLYHGALLAAATLVSAKAHSGRARRASEAPRSGGTMAARLRASSSDSPQLFERRERSEQSEFCGAPWSRAPQGSRRKAPAASAARRALPGCGFAAPMLRSQAGVELMRLNATPYERLSRFCARPTRAPASHAPHRDIRTRFTGGMAAGLPAGLCRGAAAARRRACPGARPWAVASRRRPAARGP